MKLDGYAERLTIWLARHHLSSAIVWSVSICVFFDSLDRVSVERVILFVYLTGLGVLLWRSDNRLLHAVDPKDE